MLLSFVMHRNVYDSVRLIMFLGVHTCVRVCACVHGCVCGWPCVYSVKLSAKIFIGVTLVFSSTNTLGYHSHNTLSSPDIAHKYFLLSYLHRSSLHTQTHIFLLSLSSSTPSHSSPISPTTASTCTCADWIGNLTDGVPEMPPSLIV